jgi:ppGpp synthetase/RelA/SpoT-type nucleotidyltranferase
MAHKTAVSNLAAVVAEYRDQSLVYHDFCAAMRNLLISLLDHKQFKYQLSCRIKTLDSVRGKIARNAALGKFYQRLSDVEDVAGIRIVFYLESEQRQFLAMLLREMTRSRLRMEEHQSEHGYRATHVLVKFGRKRLALNEYRRFAGLTCEVQLTSALYNAWSEVEHDILYKRDRRLAPLGRALEVRLKAQLHDAMEHYLQPASEILEAVASVARQGPPRRRRTARQPS